MSTTETKSNSDNDSERTDITYEDIQNVERGDILVIGDTEYPVFRLNSGLRSLFTPDYPHIVTPDGEVKGLAHGTLTEDSNDTETALAFVEDCEDCESGETPENLLTVGLDNVSIKEGGKTDIPSLLPSTEKKQCPNCEHENGTWQFGDRHEKHTREARKCTKCDTYYVIDRVIPESTATVRLRSHNGEWGEEVELSGIYREVVTSRFDMDPRSRAREGYYSAQEVKEFIEAKMNSDGEAEQFGYTTGREVRGGSVTWRDDRLEQKLKITFEPIR